MSDLKRRFAYSEKTAMARFFNENGYVIIKDGISPDHIADFKAELMSTINAYLSKAGRPPNGEFTAGLMQLEDIDHEYVASLYDTIFQSPAFFRLIGSKDIETTIKHLLKLKDNPLYGFTNRCLFAPPQDERRTWGWHQEVFYTIPEGSYLQTWAPLVDNATVENGTIQILPGSHKEGIAKQSWNEVPGRATQILVDEDIVAKYKPMDVEMRLGELLIFSGYLAHRSGTNSSDRVRYSLVGMYHDVGHRPFKPPKLTFNFRGRSPRDWFDAIAK
jgi:phytanoyl-CoA hydroxylase